MLLQISNTYLVLLIHRWLRIEQSITVRWLQHHRRHHMIDVIMIHLHLVPVCVPDLDLSRRFGYLAELCLAQAHCLLCNLKQTHREHSAVNHDRLLV